MKNILILITVLSCLTCYAQNAFVQTVAFKGASQLGSSTNSPVVALTNSIAAYWRLDEIIPGSHTDATGRGNTLLDNNVVTVTIGIKTNASQFTSLANNSLTIANNADVTTGNVDWTIAFWCYIDNVSNERWLVGKQEIGGVDYGFDFNGGLDGKFRFYINGGVVIVSSTITGSANTWYFVCGSHDSVADTLSLSINNGTPDNITTGGVSPNTTSSAFSVGRSGYVGFTYQLDGRIDEIGIWKRVLSASDI